MSDDILNAIDGGDLESLLGALGGSGKRKGRYDKKLDANLERNRARHREATDIGPPDESTVDRARKEKCRDCLKSFFETYFPEVFYLGWSPDHDKVIDKLERAIINGELSAIAMPRGSGKTSMVIRAAIWALLYGRRNYVALIAATADKSQALLRGIKTELLHNDHLAEDFPAELHCARSLENRAALANGQHWEGNLTGVEWSVGKICLGNIDHESCEKTNYGVIQCMGITGDIRGTQVTLPTGQIRRPDLVLVDDPQTKQSAASPTQCLKRFEVLMGDILGLSGPGISVAGLCTCTVVYAGDLADRLLDREESPEWSGQRCQLIYKFPPGDKAINLWDEYTLIHQESLRLDQGVEQANKFLKDNFDDMHEGAIVGWDERYDKSKELSALQHAYNLKIRDEAAFAAEYQNMPQTAASQLVFDLNAEEIAKRIIPGLKREFAPEEVETVTAAIDVQQNLLFYSVVGWTPTSRGYVLDYGTYPDQGRLYFTKSDVPVTMQEAAQTEDLEGALRHALSQLTMKLFTTDYGHAMVEKCVIDARWGQSTEIIRRFCKESIYRSQTHPSMGLYIGANSRPWQKMKLNKRDRKGVHCKFSPPTNGRGRPELLIDVNWWKTQIARRLTVTTGASKALVMFEDKPSVHRMFAEHLSSELPKVATSKTGNTVTEWTQSRVRDNDFLDTVVYNAALASILGVSFIDDRKKHSSSGDYNKAASKAVKSSSSDASGSSARDRMNRRKKR